MTRSRFLLAVLAARGKEAGFTVFRLQKLLFLIDREASDLAGGHHFHFSAGPYGPCDDRLHEDFALLERNGDVLFDEATSVPALSLTEKGFQKGIQVFKSLPEEARQTITDEAEWILSRSVAEIIARIFDRYPEMAMNSMFRIRKSKHPRPVDQCSRTPFLHGMASAFDLWGALRRDFSRWTDSESVADGIASDWDAVGEAFRSVMPLSDTERDSKYSRTTGAAGP